MDSEIKCTIKILIFQQIDEKLLLEHATFNNNVTVGDNLNMTTDSSVINFGA